MNENTGKNPDISDRQKEVDLQSRKANKKNIIFVVAVLVILIIMSVVLITYIVMGESNYEKGANFLKGEKYTEALYEFQKVDPDNKDFINAQSKINYINGLLNFKDGKTHEASVFLSKVSANDEYYHDAQLMLARLSEAQSGNDLQSQIDSLESKKGNSSIKKDVKVNQEKIKDPLDPVKQADLEISRKYVSDAENSISRFEGLYQSALTAPLNTKSDYGKGLESVNKEFNNIKYSPQNKDAGVIELKRLTGEWMSKRIAFIRQLITERSVSETDLSRPIKADGDRLYPAVISQLNKVKKSL